MQIELLEKNITMYEIKNSLGSLHGIVKSLAKQEINENKNISIETISNKAQIKNN